VAAGAAGLIMNCADSPSAPPPPTPLQLNAIVSRFPELRAKLERIVAAEQACHQLPFLEDSLLAAGDTTRAHEVEATCGTCLREIHEKLRPPLEGQDIVLSDSLIYISSWARRGTGFSAPWGYAGYVYASRPPDDPAAWPALVGGGGDHERGCHSKVNTGASTDAGTCFPWMTHGSGSRAGSELERSHLRPRP